MRDFIEYFPSDTLAKEKEILLVFFGSEIFIEE
jgi:hypothetical protein